MEVLQELIDDVFKFRKEMKGDFSKARKELQEIREEFEELIRARAHVYLIMYI